MLRMSAACNHVRLPANARMMTCWYVMARSTATAVKAISTPLVADGRTTPRPKSGHFTCSRERTDHVLPTPHVERWDHDAIGQERGGVVNVTDCSIGV